MPWSNQEIYIYVKPYRRVEGTVFYPSTDCKQADMQKQKKLLGIQKIGEERKNRRECF